MTILCSSRDRSRVLFGPTLEALLPGAPWLSVEHTFTRSPDDSRARFHRRIDAPMVATVLDGLCGPGSPSPARDGLRVFVAGPAEMVAATRRALAHCGVAEGAVVSELHT